MSGKGGSPNTDALNFHVCLMWDGGSPPFVDGRELAETVQSILIDDVDNWSDGLLQALASCAPATGGAEGPGGVAGQLLLGAPYELRRCQTPQWFDPERASALFARTVATARQDLRRINRASLMAPGARWSRLAAHLELLAVLAAVMRPMMPGWSAFVLEELGMSPQTHWPWDAVWGHPLLRRGQRLPGHLPGYFERWHPDTLSDRTVS
ncbi:hypothetical protein [Streptomyces sp. NPDC047046]|uniref:hypothetical protein n=1 Tax=Streptomyces sp. NPDC047046 TaxID=3155378 RepID=UPI0033E126FC